MCKVRQNVTILKPLKYKPPDRAVLGLMVTLPGRAVSGTQAVQRLKASRSQSVMNIKTRCAGPEVPRRWPRHSPGTAPPSTPATYTAM